MLREHKNKIKNIISMCFLFFTILALVFIAICVISNNIADSKTDAKESINIESVSENASVVSKDGLVLVKETWAESEYGDYSYRYYKDSVTGVMFMDFANKPLVQMEDPETGLPLTYEKYLEYQNVK